MIVSEEHRQLVADWIRLAERLGVEQIGASVPEHHTYMRLVPALHAIVDRLEKLEAAYPTLTVTHQDGSVTVQPNALLSEMQLVMKDCTFSNEPTGVNRSQQQPDRTQAKILTANVRIEALEERVAKLMQAINTRGLGTF